MSKQRTFTEQDERQRQAARADAAYTRQFNADLTAVVETLEGRRLLARLIFNMCGVLVTPPWVPSAEIHVQAGKRQIGDQLLGMLEVASPAGTRKMIDEWFKGRYEWRTAIERGGGLTTDEEMSDE